MGSADLLEMVQRLTYRRRHCWATRGNRVRVVKTPGGKLVYHHINKPGTGVKCGDCKCELQGVPAARPKEYMRMSKRVKTVSRSYGGSRCAKCVRDRIIRAFLIEEQKIVKALVKANKASEKQAAQDEKKLSGKKKGKKK